MKRIFLIQGGRGSFRAWLVRVFAVAAVLASSTASWAAGPSGVSASDGTYTDRVEVSWNAVESASEYWVYRATSPGGVKVEIGTSAGETAFDDWTVPTAEPFVTHYYWVRSDRNNDYSSFDTGWRSPEEKQIYKITYRDCTLRVVEGASLAVTNTDTDTTVKIRLQNKMPEGIGVVDGVGEAGPGVLYLVCAVIPEVNVTGNLRRIYTEAPIWDLQVTETLESLTAKDCYVVDVGASAFKRIKMRKPQNAWTDGTWIAANGRWVPLNFKRARVDLVGVGLDGLYTPEQKASVKTAAKKRNDAFGDSYVSRADIGFLWAGDFLDASVVGGDFWGDAFAEGQIDLLSARHQNFRVDGVADPVGGHVGEAYVITEFDTVTTTETASTEALKTLVTGAVDSLTTTALAAGLTTDSLQALFAVDSLEGLSKEEVLGLLAQRLDGAATETLLDLVDLVDPLVGESLADQTVVTHVEFVVTETPAKSWIVSGLDSDPDDRLDIRSVFATQGVTGSFVAGAEVSPEGAILPTFAGSLRKIRTRSGTPVVGDYWSDARAPKLLKGNFSQFFRRTEADLDGDGSLP